MSQNEKVFPKGLYYNKPHENAPDFVLGKLSVQLAWFSEWLEANQKLANDKGYLNFGILMSKNSGKPYVVVDTYEPPKETKPEISDTPFGTDADKSTPF